MENIMGGKVTIAGQFTDSSQFAFKATTDFMTNFMHDLNLLKEENMKAFLSEHKLNDLTCKTVHEHVDYHSPLAFIAPFDYGIFFFDFVNQKVISFNDYSAYMLLGSAFSRTDYEQLCLSDWHMKTKNGLLSPLEHNPAHYGVFLHSPYTLSQTMKLGGEIHWQDRVLSNMDVKDIYSTIYGEDLHNSEYSKIALKICDKHINSTGGTLLSETCDMKVHIPDWTFLNPRSAEQAWTYFHDICLTEAETDEWHSFILEAQAEKEDQ